MTGWLLLSLWAAAAPPPTAVLRTPLPGALLRRVQDQTVDSGWSLRPAPSQPGLLQDDLTLAEAHEAQAVVTVTGDPEGALLVTLTDARAGRRYAREVPALGSAVVTEEAAAVLIRDSLVALAETGALDWEVQDSLPPLAVELSAFGGVGGDGLTVHPRIGAAFAVGRSGWRLRLGAELGLPRRVALDGVELDLAQHLLRLQGGLRFALTPGLALEGGLSVGGAVVRRVTRATTGGLQAAGPSTRGAGLAGAYLRLELALGPVGLWLAGGADAVLGATTLEVGGADGAIETLARAWPVQPWASAGVSTAF